MTTQQTAVLGRSTGRRLSSNFYNDVVEAVTIYFDRQPVCVETPCHAVWVWFEVVPRVH